MDPLNELTQLPDRVHVLPGAYPDILKAAARQDARESRRRRNRRAIGGLACLAVVSGLGFVSLHAGTAASDSSLAGEPADPTDEQWVEAVAPYKGRLLAQAQAVLGFSEAVVDPKQRRILLYGIGIEPASLTSTIADAPAGVSVEWVPLGFDAAEYAQTVDRLRSLPHVMGVLTFDEPTDGPIRVVFDDRFTADREALETDARATSRIPLVVSFLPRAFAPDLEHAHWGPDRNRIRGAMPPRLVERCAADPDSYSDCGLVQAVSDGAVPPGDYTDAELEAAVRAAGYEWHPGD